MSIDSAKIWNTKQAPQRQCQTVFVSDNGKYIIASSRKGEEVFISADSGKSFTLYLFNDGTSTETVSGDGNTWYVSEMVSHGPGLVCITYKSADNGKSCDRIDCIGCQSHRSQGQTWSWFHRHRMPLEQLINLQMVGKRHVSRVTDVIKGLLRLRFQIMGI